MSSQRRPSLQTQPVTYKPSLKSILYLPYRLCNPPPAVAKVRSCGVTPIYKVQLEDILDRKHLPPLGLKDFEEWLLYVEQCPENLYFILWLREYTIKYKEWFHYSESQGKDINEYRPDWPLQSSSHLAMFYARAKQTFFTPNSDHELDLPSDILSPFHTSNVSSHPDPAVFTEVAYEVQKMLQESLKRFVVAAYNNVGNNRVLCGMIAGVTLSLAGSLPLVTYNIVHGQSRWLRLAALPAVWAGLTILFSALNGVCMAVYLMGDVRQLRKFELSRPPISKPQPLPSPRQRPANPSPFPEPVAPIPAVTQPPPLSTISTLPRSSLSSCATSIVSSSGSSTTGPEDAIHISPAYFDDEQVEGPAICSPAPDSTFTFPPKHPHDDSSSGTNSFANTASFIHPFNPLVNDEYDFHDGPKPRPEDQQPITAFDFDALPPRINNPPELPAQEPVQPQLDFHEIFVVEPDIEKQSNNPQAQSFIAYLQSKCNIKWQVAVGGVLRSDQNSSPNDLHTPPHPRRRVEKTETMVRAQFKRVRAVPAFASPLTRILNPIVVRGQWEIVIRSSALALLVAWMILGCLLAIPVR